MKEQLAKVREFQEAFKQPSNYELTDITKDRAKLRHKILLEEVLELLEASLNNDHVEMADAIIDCMYILFGTAIEVGLTAEKLENCFSEVHASNMSKLDSNGQAIFREDGKIIKGENYFRPNLAQFILDRNA